MDFSKFIQWERASRDTIDVKRVYIDMAGDLVAGIVLSDIVYWYLPTRDGAPDKLTIERDGHRWIAVRYDDWWDRVRVSPKQAERAISILNRLGIVEKALYKFDGAPTVHIRIVETAFLALLEKHINEPLQNPYRVGNGFLQKGEMDFDKKGEWISTKGGKPITKTTAETTAEINTCKASALRENDPQGVNSLFHPLDDPALESESPAISDELSVLTSGSEPLQKQNTNTMGSGDGDGAGSGDKPDKADKAVRAALKARVLARFGYDPQRMTRQEHSRVGVVVKALHEAGYSADDVDTIYAYCKARYADFSPHALTTNASAALKGRRADPEDSSPVDDGGGAPMDGQHIIALYQQWLEA